MTLTQYKQKSEPNIRLPIYGRHKLALVGTVIFITFALIVAYQPVMFDFFCSDDFYIVAWLHQCKQNIALLFQAVYEGTPYYRPVLNLFLFLEYLLCGANGFNFRLVSIAYLLLTAVILWLLVRALIPSNSREQADIFLSTKNNWPLFTVSFFLLFPLHTEPVNWFVSTTELLANIFIMASFLFFLYWRNKKLVSVQLISYLLAACAFLTKEIAVTLPAILFAYEFFVAESLSYRKTGEEIEGINKSGLIINSLSKMSLKLLMAMKITAGYWLLLFIYLCLRKIVTGEFFGNWSNAVFHFTSNQMMFNCWWQSLKIIFSPISSVAFGTNSAVRFAWLLMLVDLAFLSLAFMYKDPKKRALLAFLVSWFLICLVPMAKLLLITPDLLDARYGYIASVPLCIFLMFGLAARNRPKGLNLLRYPIFIVVLAFCCFILRSNNLAWAETGKLTSSMLEGFRSIQKLVSEDTKLYFMNIPVKNNGVAIAGLKSIDSMNHIPFANTNHNNCVWLLDDDQSLPISLISSDLKKNKIKAKFYCLNRQDERFYQVGLYESPPKDYGENIDITKDSESSETKIVFSPIELKCQNVDAFVFRLKVKRKNDSVKDGWVKLGFRNDIKTNELIEPSLVAPVFLKDGDQTMIFIMRGKPVWLFGGTCYAIELTFPKGLSVQINSARAISIERYMPHFIIQNDRYDNSSAQLNLDLKHPGANVQYDASFIKDCVGVKVEIINASEYFSELNSPASKTHSLIDLYSNKPAGQIQIGLKMFTAPGYYKVRLCPLGADGIQCGFCSDHFLLHLSD